VATLYVLQGPDKGYTIQILDESSILGRHSDQVSLSDNTISRQHSLLEYADGGWRIVDLGSSNGTYVNGERISGPTRLKHGDQIKIGATLMVFGGKTRRGHNGGTARGMVDMTAPAGAIDSSILSAVQANDDSVILAAPETAEAVRAWHLMYQLAGAIGAISSVEELLEHVTDILVQHIPVDRVFILMRDETTGELQPVVVRSQGVKDESGTITVSRTIINNVLKSNTGVLCANALTDERFRDKAAASLQNLALRSVICVPILVRDETRGIIHLDCRMSRHTYTHDQLRMATAVGRMCGMACENLRLLQQRMQNERLAAVGETVAYLSHHIRNLLQGLTSGADIVEIGLRKNDPDNVQTGWRIVQSNLDRITHLTSDMLTFSKNREPRIEMAQLNKIVEDAVTLAQHRADERGVMLLTDLADLPAVPVDPDGIHQAVFNLMINAIAACPPDADGRVNVRTRYDADAQTAAISVRDNGSGITPEHMNNLFRPFHSSKGQGGTGLGLAAAKKIVDELHGDIMVKSKPGSGTTFTITLSAKVDSDDAADQTHGPAH